MKKRGGFTLIELIVTMVVVAILGTIFARMLVQDSRFVSKLEAMVEARQTARAALTTISVETRMVSAGGVTEATPTRVGVIVPFAWGVACGRDGSATVGSLIPTDSMMFASSFTNTSSINWINAAGLYVSLPPSTAPALSTNVAACTDLADTVRALPGGQLVAIPMPDLMPPGSVFYLGESVSYEFKASTLIPSRWGLWRQDGAGVWDELLAPFDTSSGFAYYVGMNDTVNTNPPGVPSISGVELRLVGESQLNPEGLSAPEEFQLETRITFLNR